jgi:hypothetical protein
MQEHAVVLSPCAPVAKPSSVSLQDLLQDLITSQTPFSANKTFDHKDLSGADFMPEMGTLVCLPTSEWLSSEALPGFIQKMMGKCGSVDLSAPGGAEYAAMYPLWEEFCRDYPEVGSRAMELSYITVM